MVGVDKIISMAGGRVFLNGGIFFMFMLVNKLRLHQYMMAGYSIQNISLKQQMRYMTL